MYMVKKSRQRVSFAPRASHDKENRRKTHRQSRMQRASRSAEVANALAKLRQKLQGGEWREYLMLHASFDGIIHLLSIYHSRQLPSDFQLLWPTLPPDL